MFTVAEIMAQDLKTLSPEQSLEDARQLMAQHHIRHLPVIDAAGALLGLVTQRDVLAAADSSVMHDASDHSAERYVAISAIMQSEIHTVDESASLRGCALHMHQHKLGCLPVLRDGKLVGIITDADFVVIAASLMEQLEQTEPEEDFED